MLAALTDSLLVVFFNGLAVLDDVLREPLGENALWVVLFGLAVLAVV
ncbi:hypothetical protein HY572_00360 [Candidatus Micrarchaeota archaeon]|nr:hypothetical protein [Candidatus Micrarchaeota archaeon]